MAGGGRLSTGFACLSGGNTAPTMDNDARKVVDDLSLRTPTTRISNAASRMDQGQFGEAPLGSALAQVRAHLRLPAPSSADGPILSAQSTEQIHVIILSCNILQKSSILLQHYGLDIFLNLLKESFINRTSCCRAGMLSFLLNWFSMEETNDLFPKMAKLFQIVGGHNISGKDIRKIFALLRSEKFGSK